MKSYHIGLLKCGKTLIVETAQDIDCLSPDIWKYYHERVITKKTLKRVRNELLEAINDEFGTNFERCEVR